MTPEQRERLENLKGEAMIAYFSSAGIDLKMASGARADAEAIEAALAEIDRLRGPNPHPTPGELAG